MRALRDIGVLILKNGEVRLAQDYLLEDQSLEDEREDYRQIITTGLMSSVDLVAGWGGESDAQLPGSTDLARSLAWWVLQPPDLIAYWPRRSMPKLIADTGFDVEGAKLHQLMEPKVDGQVIHNYERWQSFVRWSTYVGFATPAVPPMRAKAKARYVFVDPTRAIHRAIRRMASGPRIFEDFYTDLLGFLPILPGGPVALSIESHFAPQVTPQSRQLPPAVSAALLQLESLHVLELQREPDPKNPWSLRILSDGSEAGTSQERLVSDVTITL